ncbi:hypothetical protein [Paraburkholderia humisilvae]|uniref:Uncharacterized protein n=1 Tax=Paraburkholderia humisilvae TaxID=627669 RepID=A0A6J5DWQ4_9BURK|nr:hypothetical protein [Paraburkholderia humisilvae]CAB3758639.1 hypothetical protein LMG29542_03393 [Paraburkholderia humisilvae]
MPTKEAQHLQPGDVLLHAGISRHVVVTVTPVGRPAGRVEVKTYQLGKPDNVAVTNMPAQTLVEVVLP